MKILYLSGGQGIDYQCDLLFHGLRSLFGPDVVDCNPLWWMYEGCFQNGRNRNALYGKGFSIAETLPNIEVDRTDLAAKVKAKFFDLVIFGSIWRENQAWGEVTQHYPRHKVLAIDGEDGPEFLKDCLPKSLYFKRELHSSGPGEWLMGRDVFPIQFAIPACKIKEPLPKLAFMAPLDPLDRTTYIYDDEQAYYDQYRDAKFAKTMHKAGWDCLRHYEIMACGCLPYFANLEACPATIMQELPKQELLTVKAMLDYNHGELFRSSAGDYIREDLQHEVSAGLREKLTTVALAKRVLDVQRQQEK
jgi:hypothetical protein